MQLRNEGSVDRTLRVLVGAGLLAFGLLAKTPWGLVGLIPLLTGSVGFCPLYTLFGLRTNHAPQSKA
jgi:hypothetical protein